MDHFVIIQGVDGVKCAERGAFMGWPNFSNVPNDISEGNAADAAVLSKHLIGCLKGLGNVGAIKGQFGQGLGLFCIILFLPTLVS